MSALEIIEAIKQLPPEEQARVADFLWEFEKEGQLSGSKLGHLAQKMIDAEDPGEKSRIREEIVEGFYGK